MRKVVRLGLFIAACLFILWLAAFAARSETTDPLAPPEFPFQNTAQTGGLPGWTQTGVQEGACSGVPVYLLQYTNPAGQLLQIFSDAQKKIIGAWYPDGHAQYPTHIWLGTINPENGKITMGAPVPFNPETFSSPCVYWRDKSGA